MFSCNVRHLTSRKVLWVICKMADKQEVFEMKNFASSLQFFETYVRFCILKTSRYDSCGQDEKEALDVSLQSEFKEKLCKFGAFLKSRMSKTSKNSGDLIVKVQSEKFRVQVR